MITQRITTLQPARNGDLQGHIRWQSQQTNTKTLIARLQAAAVSPDSTGRRHTQLAIQTDFRAQNMAAPPGFLILRGATSR